MLEGLHIFPCTVLLDHRIALWVLACFFQYQESREKNMLVLVHRPVHIADTFRAKSAAKQISVYTPLVNCNDQQLRSHGSLLSNWDQHGDYIQYGTNMQLSVASFHCKLLIQVT